jgi:hypothetical protein
MAREALTVTRGIAVSRAFWVKQGSRRPFHQRTRPESTDKRAENRWMLSPAHTGVNGFSWLPNPRAA